MIHLVLQTDQNLEAYGSRPLTSIATAGTSTLTRGRPFGHSMRTSIRYSTGRISRTSREFYSRPPSQASRGSRTSDELATMMRPPRHTYSPSSPRLSGTFVDLRANRLSAASVDTEASGFSSNRSSIISTTSSSTITSLNVSANNNLSHLISDVRKAAEEGGISGKITPIAENPLDSPTSSPESDPENTTVYDTPV